MILFSDETDEPDSLTIFFNLDKIIYLEPIDYEVSTRIVLEGGKDVILVNANARIVADQLNRIAKGEIDPSDFDGIFLKKKEK